MRPHRLFPTSSSILLLLASSLAGVGCTDDPDGVDPDPEQGTPPEVAPPDPDTNGNGVLDVLVLGSSRSLGSSGAAFDPAPVAAELQRILTDDESIEVAVNVVAEDIHLSKDVLTGYGQGGEEYEWTYYGHSLVQYLFWPDGQAPRLANLAGEGEADWDQVVIAGDPYILSTMPGYYALGAGKVAALAFEGGAQPRLLMPWPQDESTASIEHLAEFVSRAADGAPISLPVVPVALAWDALDADLKDSAAVHPTPNGAYLAAAAIYSQLTGRSAALSAYDYDNALAEGAAAAVADQAGQVHYSGQRTFVSPFHRGDIDDRVLNYNHTGSSSENGILRGLRWVLERAQVRLESGGDAPIDFNYGRANTEFEANKRYQVDPAQFEFSLGFPMQDHSNHGDTSMLYGLDRRRYEGENGTDLGAARLMIDQSELPTARVVPIRTLFAQLRDGIPTQSAYSDGWHMDHDLDKASGAYLYTLLTGHCAVGTEPEDSSSEEWRSWLAHKTGYETAWTVMHLSGAPPCFRVLPDNVDSTWVSPTQQAGLSISFANPPSANVTVSLSIDNGGAATVEPAELLFTPADHQTPQTVVMSGLAGEFAEEAYTVTATTRSSDSAFDGLIDRWRYTVHR